MKTLILVRHGDATPAVRGTDWERPLSPRGERDIDALGQRLKGVDAKVDKILTSHAIRAETTCKILASILEPKDGWQAEESFYDGSLEALSQALAGQPWNTVMAVGHNPVWSAIATQLRGSAVMLSPGQMAWLQLDGEDSFVEGLKKTGKWKQFVIE